MRSPRLLLLVLLLLGLSAGIWQFVVRTSDTRSCLPTDQECLLAALDDARPAGLTEQVRLLSDAALLAADDRAAVCHDLGFGLGSASTQPATDLLSLLDPTTSALTCRAAVVAGLLERWSTVSITASNDELRRVAGEMVALCRTAPDPLCGEAVAAGALLALPNDDAITTCYRLTADVAATCRTSLMQRILDRATTDPDRDVSRDPREELVALCAYWPSTTPQEDCFAAVGPALFSGAFGTLGFSGPVDPTPLRAAVGFCDRLGPGSTNCQAAAFRLAVWNGQAGAVNSERRRTYCAVFDLSLRAECLGIDASATEPGTPG